MDEDIGVDSPWSNDGVKALKIQLSRPHPTENETVTRTFNPTFVYPIFGEEERIYGYKGLAVNLRLTSGALSMLLDIAYSQKLPDHSAVKADDIEGTLYKFIPPDYLKSEDEFEKRIQHDWETFKPVGEKIAAYKKNESYKGVNGANGNKKGKGKARARGSGIREKLEKWVPVKEGEDVEEEEVIYEAYRTTWSTPGFREYHRRMQIFVLLLIEGGSYIDEDEDKWEFVVLYERRKRPKESSNTDNPFAYHFVGYTSLYSFFHWPDKIRLRLSQFIILPPYHGEGHGTAFYSLLYNYLMTRSDIAELTVEDPSEAFEDLRDKGDFSMILSKSAFDDFEPPVDRTKAETLRKELKLADRQFVRLLEMGLLHRNSEYGSDLSDDPKARAFRLWVKERLYRFNYDVLSQLEQDERKAKLQETFERVMEDYERLLAGFRS